MLVLLRWLVGILSLLALAGFALILLAGKGFDAYRSGSATQDLWRAALTYGAPALLAAMLVSVFTPGARLFLHVTALGVVIALAGCATIVTSHPGEGLLYVCFFGLWLLYYALAVLAPKH